MFLALLGLLGIYEIVTLTDGIENNTISHAVASYSEEYAWLPSAFVIFFGVLFVFALTCALHWWPNEKRPFWWPKAKFVEKQDNSKNGE